MSRRVCELVAVCGSPRLTLPHARPLLLGRGRLSGIADVNCSRQQLSLTANCDDETVSIKQLGKNLSGVDGFALPRDKEIIVGDNTHIEFILNQHIFVVKFSKPTDTSEKVDTKIEQKFASSTHEVVDCENSFKKEARKSKLDPDSEQSDAQCKKIKIEDPLLNMPKSNVLKSENMFENIENGLLYILTTNGVKSSSKIAAYDIDGTLIKTKSNRVFPKDIDDWRIAFTEVPGKLKKYENDGYKIVLFTNQASIGNRRLKATDFKGKVEKILKRIGVSAQVFISTGHGRFRKPATGMWETLANMKNDGIKINMSESFYCGDAAGRKSDHSFADRFFAENVGLKFVTPEEHFMGSKALPFKEASFNPNSLNMSVKYPDIIKTKQEILVLVGFPGCGKSYFSNMTEVKSNYKYKSVCQDILGSLQKCYSQAEKLLKMGKSVIIDRTNLDILSREKWTSLAQNCGIDCRCFVFDVSIAHCKHNNLFRQVTDKKHVVVTEMVYNTCKSKYKEPDMSEGFAEIIKTTFVPDFADRDKLNLYMKHYLEK